MAESKDDVKLAEMAKDIFYIRKQLDHIDQQVSSNYVTKNEFEPIKRFVYGLIALVLGDIVLRILGARN